MDNESTSISRKEAVWRSLRSGTRCELLERLCHNRYGSPWQVQFGDDERGCWTKTTRRQGIT